MNFRVAALLVLLSGCLAPVDVGGNDAGRCNMSNCAGCCDPSGVCQIGAVDAQCGKGGAACGACGQGDSCQAGQCQVEGLCTLPSTIEFGAVQRGDTSVRTIELKNPTSAALSATYGGIASNSGDDRAFTTPPYFPGWTIPAGATSTIEITFAPTEIKDYVARATVRLSDSCPDQIIRLNGSGVDTVLTWAPNPLDFGYLPIGVERILPVTFTNAGLKPVELSSVFTSPSDFRLVTPQPMTVPANGILNVLVAATPSTLGPRNNGRLDFTTDLPRQPSGTVALKFYGGGPDIDGPSTFNVGSIGYFAGANPPAFVSRRLTIKNVGTRPTPPDPTGNLHLGSNGTGVIYWDAFVKTGVPNNTADISELCVGEFLNGVCTNKLASGSYDPAVGLEANGNKSTLDIPIRVTPTSLGIKEWTVFVYSNDPDEPVFIITVHAESISLPPCNYDVSPLSLNFGLVPSGASRELPVSISNKSQVTGEICLLSSLSLGSGSNAAFSLVGGDVSSFEILPGSTKTVSVRFAPTGTPPATPTAVSASVELSISNPTKPFGTIPIAGMTGPSCVSIVPDHFDFGLVEQACSGATRTFLVYNTCTSPVEVTSSSLVQPASEFVAVSTAGVAPTTVINPGASPASFSLKYHPTNLGPDAAAFALHLTQNALPVDYVVPLTGTGGAQAIHVETLKAGGNGKADVLLVIDNSCSMGDKQLALASGLTSFLTYANANAVDYQLAVTTSDMDVEGGKLIHSATQPMIITPSTPNPQSVFSANVQVGVNGSGVEQLLAPALAAVSPPLTATDNLGFLRPGAKLGIVSISDADDQSPQPVSYYVNLLLAVKPAGDLTFSALTPLQATAPAGCSYDGAGGAPRTVAGVAALSGVTRDICSQNFPQALQDLGPTLFGGNPAAFPLLFVPDLTNGKVISLEVANVATPPTTAGGATVWTWDPIGNQVVFEPLYQPAPAQKVVATYSVACLP